MHPGSRVVPVAGCLRWGEDMWPASAGHLNNSLFPTKWKESSIGLKLNSAWWLSCSAMCVHSHTERQCFKTVSCAVTSFEGVQTHSFILVIFLHAYGPEKHAYFSLCCFPTFIVGTAAKTAVPTFHYNSTMERFQRAGPTWATACAWARQLPPCEPNTEWCE